MISCLRRNSNSFKRVFPLDKAAHQNIFMTIRRLRDLFYWFCGIAVRNLLNSPVMMTEKLQVPEQKKTRRFTMVQSKTKKNEKLWVMF